MTSFELLQLLGSARDSHISDAYGDFCPVKPRISRHFLLVAALVSLALLLVGCTVAYASGWFEVFFAKRSGSPLSDDQIHYIQENQQLIQERQTQGDWTVELNSAISDGQTGYILLRVTAPEAIDLEQYAKHIGDDYITPGNNSWNRHPSRAMIVASTGFADEEKNFIWQGGGGGGWQEDHDGKCNTMNYMLSTGVEKLDPSREMLLENPFGKDVTFTVRVDGFTREYEDPEIRKKIEEKYAGMTDYMVDDADLVGLHKSETLTEECWEFTVTFDVVENKSVELIHQPTMTWAQVIWKLDDHPVFYETGTGIGAVAITSFRLSPFGAVVTYDLKEPALSAFLEYQDSFGFEDRPVYAVMQDGSKIALRTHSTGDQLRAESPIVLEQLDHVLLGDGVKLFPVGEGQ